MRKYDLLILGAATPLGALVLNHVHTFLPKGLKWAIVGQLDEKLELESEVRKCGERAPGMIRCTRRNRRRALTCFVIAIEICSYNKSEIATLVRSTKVIVMLPAQNVREEAELWIIEACAKNGTHYIDSWVSSCFLCHLTLTKSRKSGETCWLKAMIQKYHDAAKDTGVIVCSLPPHIQLFSALTGTSSYRMSMPSVQHKISSLSAQ